MTAMCIPVESPSVITTTTPPPLYLWFQKTNVIVQTSFTLSSWIPWQGHSPPPNPWTFAHPPLRYFLAPLTCRELMKPCIFITLGFLSLVNNQISPSICKSIWFYNLGAKFLLKKWIIFDITKFTTKLSKDKRKCLFLATVATDSAVFVATLPVECQSWTVTQFSHGHRRRRAVSFRLCLTQ